MGRSDLGTSGSAVGASASVSRGSGSRICFVTFRSPDLGSQFESGVRNHEPYQRRSRIGGNLRVRIWRGPEVGDCLGLLYSSVLAHRPSVASSGREASGPRGGPPRGILPPLPSQALGIFGFRGLCGFQARADCGDFRGDLSSSRASRSAGTSYSPTSSGLRYASPPAQRA
jgi:hypothetical protein